MALLLICTCIPAMLGCERKARSPGQRPPESAAPRAREVRDPPHGWRRVMDESGLFSVLLPAAAPPDQGVDLRAFRPWRLWAKGRRTFGFGFPRDSHYFTTPAEYIARATKEVSVIRWVRLGKFWGFDAVTLSPPQYRAECDCYPMVFVSRTLFRPGEHQIIQLSAKSSGSFHADRDLHFELYPEIEAFLDSIELAALP